MTRAAAESPPSSSRRRMVLGGLAWRHPFVYWFGLIIASNAAATVFSFAYNLELIVGRLMDPAQRDVFWTTALFYNLIAYTVGMGLMVWLVRPLIHGLRAMQRAEAMAPERLEFCRRRAVNLPILQIAVNLPAWWLAGIVFPAAITVWGGWQHAGAIWTRFLLSFAISGIYATAQTFFLMEWFLVAVLYQDLFRDARPAEVRGAIRIPFGTRMLGLWLAVGVMPLAAVTAMAYYSGPEQQLATLAVAGVGLTSGLGIFLVVRDDLQHWMLAHATATERVAREDFAVRVVEKRPDEWGRLSDGFNDMAAALARAQRLRVAFGQFVSPAVRDAIIERYPGLQASLQEITVLFADLRGFTSRCAGQPPREVGDLLNRFFTLAVGAIEENGGYVNKFLGDGILALFGAIGRDERHADRAVICAQDLLARLDRLNADLRQASVAPLVVGIGIHTGPALVGCFGAEARREFSAIGATVNLGQRVEQMTKSLGGPILLSETTRERLVEAFALRDLGLHALSGAPLPLRLFAPAVPSERREDTRLDEGAERTEG